MPKFSPINALKFDIGRITSQNENLADIMSKNSAKYHHTCKTKYNIRMLQRETDKLDRVKVSSGPISDIDAQSPPFKRRSSVSSKDGDRSQFICCFCNEADSQENLVAAGTLYAKKSKTAINHVNHLTDTWLEMAKCLGDENLLRLLSHGDVASNELFYYKATIKCCYQKYRKKYLKKIAERNSDRVHFTMEWFKVDSMNKVIFYIKEKEIENPGTIFEVKELENMYIGLLKSRDICAESHVSRFAKKLQERIPGLLIRNINKNLTMFFNSTADALISESIRNSDDFYRTMIDLVTPLRNMMASTTNNFSGDLDLNIQEKSVPI